MRTGSGTNSTIINDSTGFNKTSTAISTNILIMVNGTAVGAIQKLAINEARTIKQIDEVGTDGHIDSVPVSSTNITGSCDRIRFDKLRIAEAFRRGFIHVASQIYPFDITIIDRQKREKGSQISTTIKNVWIKSIGYTYSVDTWVISDSMEWEAETIFSLQGSGSVATGGEIGIVSMSPTSTTTLEREVDRGAFGRRGSLDAAGLIDIGSSGDWY